MKLLLDENLSPRLSSRLIELYGEILHARAVGLSRVDDREIWDWAKQNGCTIVTADADFVRLSEHLGCPPQVVHIEHCDYPFRTTENLLRRNAIRIAEFIKFGQSGVLSIRSNTE